MLRSIVEYYAEHEQYKCGYCKRPDTNYSHGMWAHTMTVSDYQDLIDRGWRRSGKYCYKPTMDVTCCPMYTIRCRALEFKPTKSQKKVLKRVNKLLIGEETSQPSRDGERKMSTCSSGSEVLAEGFEEGGEQFIETMREHQDIDYDIASNRELLDFNAGEGVGDGLVQKDTIKAEQLNSIAPQEKIVNTESGPDPNKAPRKKAKQLRRERKLEKLKERGIDVASISPRRNKEKQIEDFINELPDDVKHKLEIKLVRTTPPSPEWLATAKESHEVYVKYQTTIHDDTPDKCTEPKFKDFLVQSPLLEEHRENGPHCGYGSFHQQYWLDGKIIAVGVIDILPKCVSSVYFFYDPHYMNLTLGTYGALREIEFTRRLHSECPQIEYYYMGYYIHSCCKMRYKGNFFPSDLLCPETYKWIPLVDCIPKLEASPYSRLDPDLDSVDENFPKESDLNYIPIWINGTVMLYKAYKRHAAGKKNGNQTNELIEYSRLVGSKSAKSLILEEHRENGPHCGYGSFHQQYWLDGKIIAVGVIDILPKCISSVYFFYDPQYMNLTLGTYGALREIEFTRRLHSECPQIEYYYMGYYIHSCCKMRYKGNFFPSDLLCPETYKWIPLVDCIPKLEASPYSRLDPDLDSVDENFPKESDLNYIPIWINGTVMLYKAYKRHAAGKKNGNQTNELIEYSRLVGSKSAKSLILVR